MRRTPGFAAVVIITLAIGIGANTAVFSILNGILLKPLAYPDPDRLVAVWQSAPGAEGLAAVSGDLRLSPSMYYTYAEQNRTFEHLGVWYTTTATVTGTAEPEEVRGVFVSDGVLEALGVQPVRGRWLSHADQAPIGPATVMLSEGFWQRRFGADPQIVGRTILVDSQPSEVVGIMPKGFRVADTDGDLIVPIRFDRSRVKLPGFGFQGIARLKPGVTIAAANADIARLVPIWMTSWPAAEGVNPRIYEGWRIAPALRPLKQDVVGNVGKALWIVMGTLGIVMLIACANVATLMLVRADGRQQELAIRAALGAGSRRIVRVLLVESVLLALLGGAVGLLLASAGLAFLLAQAPSGLPRVSDIAIDLRVLAFAFGVSAISGFVFGLVPALRHASPRLAASLSAVGRTASDSRARLRARHALVVAQVALALVLLVAAGLMIRTFGRLRAVEPGFAHANEMQTLRISIPRSLVPEPERVARMQVDLVEKLAALPGVTAVALASTLPMDGNRQTGTPSGSRRGRYGATEIPPLRFFKQISPGYLNTIGTRLIAGRDFSWTDLSEIRPVVIVSENLARESWGSAAAAIGKRIQTLVNAPWREVIGVAQNVAENGVHEPPPTTVYWPTTSESAYRAGETDVDALRHVRPAQPPRRHRALPHRDSARGVVDQREPARRGGADAAGDLRPFDVAHVVHADDPGDRRADGADAGHRRHLRRHLVCGVAADPGDRDSPRARRPAWRADPHVRPFGRHAGVSRRADRARRGGRAHRPDVFPALRHQPARSRRPT